MNNKKYNRSSVGVKVEFTRSGIKITGIITTYRKNPVLIGMDEVLVYTLTLRTNNKVVNQKKYKVLSNAQR